MNQLENDINNIFDSYDDSLLAYRKIIALCKLNLESLRQKVLKEGFLNERDEIIFFKKTKQIPLVNLLFYSELYKIELETQLLNQQDRKCYYENKRLAYDREIQEHKDFFQYVRLDSEHFDNYYFIRNKKSLTPLYFQVEHNPDFSTTYDFLKAKLNSRMKLLSHINEEISKSNNKKSTKLKWTAPKVALVELIYALYFSKVFDRGSSDLKDITATFQNMFDVDLKDVYRVFTDIKSRKIEPTRFLNELQKGLLIQMELDNKR